MIGIHEYSINLTKPMITTQKFIFLPGCVQLSLKLTPAPFEPGAPEPPASPDGPGSP